MAVVLVDLPLGGIAQVMPHSCVRKLVDLVGIAVTAVVAEEDLGHG